MPLFHWRFSGKPTYSSTQHDSPLFALWLSCRSQAKSKTWRLSQICVVSSCRSTRQQQWKRGMWGQYVTRVLEIILEFSWRFFKEPRGLKGSLRNPLIVAITVTVPLNLEVLPRTSRSFRELFGFLREFKGCPMIQLKVLGGTFIFVQCRMCQKGPWRSKQCKLASHHTNLTPSV